jgi:hypothetical protein
MERWYAGSCAIILFLTYPQAWEELAEVAKRPADEFISGIQTQAYVHWPLQHFTARVQGTRAGLVQDCERARTLPAMKKAMLELVEVDIIFCDMFDC